MHAGQERETELRPDPVGTRHEHRVGDAGRVEAKETAERPDLRQDARRERGSRERAYAAHDLVAGFDVDSRLLVIHQKSSVWMRASAMVRAGAFTGAAQYARRTAA